MLKKSDVFILSALHNNDYKNAQPVKVKTLINFIPKYFFGFGDFKATSVIIHLLFNYQRYALHMPWDNSVNKNGIIYADHTTLDVRNMPLTS